MEAVVLTVTGKKSEFEVARMASERVIVRASNPGQFETDSEPPWSREMTSDTVYHMGKITVRTMKKLVKINFLIRQGKLK